MNVKPFLKRSKRIYLLASMLAFILFGSWFLGASHAATSVLSVETENGTTASNVAKVTDGTASNGSAVKFGVTGGGVVTTRNTNCLPVLSATMTNNISHQCGFPDATNTGVPAGTTLTPSGSITVTTAGAIIQNLDISGSITIRANNVTIKNCRITSSDYYPVNNLNDNTGLLVEDTEIVATAYTVTSGIAFDNYTALRVNVHGSADGLKTEENVTVIDSYIHDLDASNGNHSDGIQSTGGSNVNFSHNTVLNADGNSCIRFGTENGNASNITVNNNLMDGGGYCITMFGTGTNINLTNNHFGRDSAYGVYYITATVNASGNVWDDTGAANNPT